MHLMRDEPEAGRGPWRNRRRIWCGGWRAREQGAAGAPLGTLEARCPFSALLGAPESPSPRSAAARCAHQPGQQHGSEEKHDCPQSAEEEVKPVSFFLLEMRKC